MTSQSKITHATGKRNPCRTVWAVDRDSSFINPGFHAGWSRLRVNLDKQTLEQQQIAMLHRFHQTSCRIVHWWLGYRWNPWHMAILGNDSPGLQDRRS